MARTEAHVRAEKKYSEKYQSILLRLDPSDPYDRCIIETLDIVRGDLTRGGWMRVFGKPAVARALGILDPAPVTGARADELEDDGDDAAAR